MLLWGVNPQSLVREESVDLSSDVALETSDRLLLGQPFLGASIDVLGGAGVIDHAGDHDVPQSGVRLTITAAIESVPVLLATAGFDW
jgi:hypothetical protein